MTCLGLDIGGANLKAADGAGWAQNLPFPLWQRPNELAAALADLLNGAPACERLAITMTGELCDCFRTKADGVRHILKAVKEAAGERENSVYLVDGQFVSIDTACEMPNRAAASNWHALASFACRFTGSRPGLLIDIGSTTSDLIRMDEGQPCATGATDTERLLAGELIYTGIGRTPICAVTTWLPWRGGRCPVAAEVFATTADAYLLLGDLAEHPETASTPDGRPLLAQFARERLARMICADATQFDEGDARRAAEAIRDAQLDQLQKAWEKVTGTRGFSPECYVISGSGEFLARRLLDGIAAGARIVSLEELLGSLVSACAAAHAVAVLAREAAHS